MSSISPFSEPLPSPPLKQAPAVPVAAPVKPKTKAPRKRVNTAEKRHQHNAIERARRETLNTKFLTLARLLPSLANHRRPSKSAIVNGSITHVNKAREQRLMAATLLKELCKERDDLFEELNEWRKAGGVGRKEGAATAWTDEMEQVCSVETEVFGNFASMGGDEDGEEESELVELVDTDFAMPSVPVNGLITPRMSTDIDPMSIFAQPQRPSAVNFNGMNWSNEFANQLGAPLNHGYSNQNRHRACPTVHLCLSVHSCLIRPTRPVLRNSETASCLPHLRLPILLVCTRTPLRLLRLDHLALLSTSSRFYLNSKTRPSHGHHNSSCSFSRFSNIKLRFDNISKTSLITILLSLRMSQLVIRIQLKGSLNPSLPPCSLNRLTSHLLHLNRPQTWV
jgi:hypothetical protein